MMSPPAKRVQVVAGSNAVPVSATGRLAWSVQSARSRTRSTPNRLAVPQARARTDGPDVVGPQEREALAVRGEVRAEGRGIGGFDEPGRVGRPLDPERREDRVGLARDEFERVVALAGPGQHGRDLAPIRVSGPATGSG